MRYFLWKAILGRTPRLPLSIRDYRALEQAWQTVQALLPLEEEFDALLQNYIELELAFLSTAMQSMVLSQTDLVEIRKIRLVFARHLSNLLSSCRSYLDHSPHHLKAFGAEAADYFDKIRSAAYDSEFAYRFMEALRNYAQHRGSPLHGTTFNTKRVERPEGATNLQYSVWASVSVAKLRADKKFKQSVLQEIPEDEIIDVLAMCRIYIEKIGELHGKIREELSRKATDAIALLRSALDRYETETNEGRVGIAFARSTSDRVVDYYQPIPEDILELYEYLVRQNRHVINLRRRFVSNELLVERTHRNYR